MVAMTPLCKFKDNIVIRLEAVENSKAAVNIRSISRFGQADFGTNTRHIIDLYSQLGSLM